MDAAFRMYVTQTHRIPVRDPRPIPRDVLVDNAPISWLAAAAKIDAEIVDPELEHNRVVDAYTFRPDEHTLRELAVNFLATRGVNLRELVNAAIAASPALSAELAQIRATNAAEHPVLANYLPQPGDDAVARYRLSALHWAARSKYSRDVEYREQALYRRVTSTVNLRLRLGVDPAAVDALVAAYERGDSFFCGLQ